MEDTEFKKPRVRRSPDDPKIIKPKAEMKQTQTLARRGIAEMVPDALEVTRRILSADATQMSREEFTLLKMQQDASKDILEQSVGKAPPNETLKTQRGTRTLNLILPDSGRMKQQAQDIWKTIDKTGNPRKEYGGKTTRTHSDSESDLEGQEQDEGDPEVEV